MTTMRYFIIMRMIRRAAEDVRPYETIDENQITDKKQTYENTHTSVKKFSSVKLHLPEGQTSCIRRMHIIHHAPKARIIA